ncbi:MAG: universal stress protein [Candidatus Sulfotelmatobacter sp.]
MPTVAQVSRLSLKNILFPTDFSPASLAALPYAERLAQIYGSNLLIAHSIPPEARQMVVADRFLGADDGAWQEARQKLHAFSRDHSLDEIPHKTLLDRGDVGEVIPAIIHEHEVDLIVLGTHGYRGISKIVMGSAAEKIYRSATCPVLTVGPKATQANQWSLRTILCPIDTAEDSSPVLNFALSLAEENQSELILLQAIPMIPWQHRSAVEMQARLGLESLIPEQTKDWCTPRFAIRWEHPAEAVLGEAHEIHPDLIVMSVHKSRATSLASHLPWPVASEVVSRASCPVLTVRV